MELPSPIYSGGGGEANSKGLAMELPSPSIAEGEVRITP